MLRDLAGPLAWEMAFVFSFENRYIRLEVDTISLAIRTAWVDSFAN